MPCSSGPHVSTDVRRIYDLSVPLESGGLVYPGNPEIEIGLQQAIASGAGANVSSLRFGSHTGTHVDAPRHFFDDGAGVGALPLDVLMGPAPLIALEPGVMAAARGRVRPAGLTHVGPVLLTTGHAGGGREPP